jgi:hypothetical protein
MLESMRTSTLDGPPYVKMDRPYAQNWVSKTLSAILCSNTMVVCIDTFK